MDLYTYRATINYVHDGDTINVDLDQGLDQWHKRLNVRFLGGNAAELRTPGGDAAAANLKAMLPLGTVITLRSVAWDKFGGRVDADVVQLAGVDLIQLLITEQWLAPWDGTGPKPVPPWPRTVSA
jgi:endonuclease YncB( thermonuclease family)